MWNEIYKNKRGMKNFTNTKIVPHIKRKQTANTNKVEAPLIVMMRLLSITHTVYSRAVAKK